MASRREAPRENGVCSMARLRLLRDELKCDKVQKQNCYGLEGVGAGVGAGVGSPPRAASTLAARCRDHVTTAAAPAKSDALGPKMTVATQQASTLARRDRGASFDHEPTRRSGRPSSTSSSVQSLFAGGVSKMSSTLVA